MSSTRSITPVSDELFDDDPVSEAIEIAQQQKADEFARLWQRRLQSR